MIIRTINDTFMTLMSSWVFDWGGGPWEFSDSPEAFVENWTFPFGLDLGLGLGYLALVWACHLKDGEDLRFTWK